MPERKKTTECLYRIETYDPTRIPIAEFADEIDSLALHHPTAYFYAEQVEEYDCACGIYIDKEESVEDYEARLTIWKEKEEARLEERIAKAKAKLKELEDARVAI